MNITTKTGYIDTERVKTDQKYAKMIVRELKDVCSRCNTQVYMSNDRICFQYHNTIIAKVYLSPINGRYNLEFNNGHWETRTTKDRINAIMNHFGIPFSIYQKDFTWYVYDSTIDNHFPYTNHMCWDLVYPHLSPVTMN